MAELTFLLVLRKAGRCLCGATRQLQQSEEITTRKTSPPPPPPPRLLLFRFFFFFFFRTGVFSGRQQSDKPTRSPLCLSLSRMAQTGRHEKPISTPVLQSFVPAERKGAGDILWDRRTGRNSGSLNFAPCFLQALTFHHLLYRYRYECACLCVCVSVCECV